MIIERLIEFIKFPTSVEEFLLMIGNAYLKIASTVNNLITANYKVYDDMQVSVNNIAKGVKAPTDRLYTYEVGDITFATLGFAKNDYVHFDIQTSHSMEINSTLEVHIHFTLPSVAADAGKKIVWRLDVIYATVDGTWTLVTGSPFTSPTYVVVTGDNTIARMLSIATLPAVNTTVSTIYKCILTRVDGVATEYPPEAYLVYIDCHYLKDTNGSATGNAK